MVERIAGSLASLREQINKAAPGRSKISDGWIGDKAHRKTKSDHNPDKYGIVRALDITHDPKNGVDGNKLAAAAFAGRDKRLKYVIWNKRIMSGSHGPAPWQWRAYNGKNPHDRHIHYSVLGGAPGALGDKSGDWNIGDLFVDPNEPDLQDWPVLRRGDKGHSVMLLQQALAKAGYSIRADSDFGPLTEKTVKAFQKAKGLVPDGIVGPYTWRALLS